MEYARRVSPLLCSAATVPKPTFGPVLHTRRAFLWRAVAPAWGLWYARRVRCSHAQRTSIPITLARWANRWAIFLAACDRLNVREILFERKLDFGFDVPVSLSDGFYMLAIDTASHVKELIFK
jgi:hypothetical protein